MELTIGQMDFESVLRCQFADAADARFREPAD
jgi:hypothetical protein